MNPTLFNCDVIKKLSDKKVAIYGCGKEGCLFLRHFENKLNIVCFIDGSKKGTIEGIEIVTPKEYARNYVDAVVVITSMLYSDEMVKTLKQLGVKENYYFIWDKYVNDGLSRMIEHNRKYFNISTDNKDGEILIPIEDVLDGTELIYGYVSNVLSKKSNSSITAYVRRGGTRFEPHLHKSVVDFYKSFGTNKFITVEDMDSEVIRKEYGRIVASIGKLEEWNDITIFGMKMGISVIRDYLRFYELSFEPLSKEFCECLYKAVNSVFFWKKYLVENNVRNVVLWDGVHNESYLREIAVSMNIPTFIIQLKGAQKATKDFNFGDNYKEYKKFFDNLPEEAKKEGILWAKKELDRVFSGEVPEYRGSNASIFNFVDENTYLGENDNTKVVICPHIFDEDEWNRGYQVCSNNYLCWFKILGEISEKTDYDWYIKLHPDEGERGLRFIEEYIAKYPKIKKLKQKISPIQLSREGVDYVITIGGSVGHEYPLLGVDVINGGNNPHIAFDFNINPKNENELKEILMNLNMRQKYSKLANLNQLYEYYCTAYRFLPRNDYSDEFRKILNLQCWPEDCFETIYEEFLKNVTEENEKRTFKQIEEMLIKMDLNMTLQLMDTREDMVVMNR